MSAVVPALASDVLVENHGTIFLLQPLTPEADSWVARNIDTDSMQYFGGAIVVEHRFIRDIVAGMQRAGLVVV